VTGKRLLIVAHAPSPNTARLRDALIDGARARGIGGVAGLRIQVNALRLPRRGRGMPGPNRRFFGAA